jgi:hypothetical protein
MRLIGCRPGAIYRILAARYRIDVFTLKEARERYIPPDVVASE